MTGSDDVDGGGGCDWSMDDVEAPGALRWPSVSRRGMQISRGGLRGVSRHQQHQAAAVSRRLCCPRVADEVDSGPRGRGRRAWGVTAYELSDDLRDKQRQVLARRYGGSTTAGHAAAVIQHAYRRHCMARNFAKLRLEADRRWRRGRGGGGGPLDLTRSRTVWTDMTATVDALEQGRGGGVTTAPGAAGDGLSADCEYDELVMSHSYSADNMLAHCSTLTRCGYQRPRDLGEDDVDRQLEAAAAGQLRYISSGDSSDEDGDGSTRASPVTAGVDPTSADFESVLEANAVDSDDDSFSSAAAVDDDDEEDPDDDVPAATSSTTATSSVVGRCSADSPVLEVPVCGATVRLRRKKPAEDAGGDAPWQRQSSTADTDDEAHHRRLNEVLECGAGLTDSLECLAMMAGERSLLDSTLSSTLNSTLSSTLDSLSRDIAECDSLSPTSSLTSPAQRQTASDKLRKRTYRIGLNLFNK